MTLSFGSGGSYKKPRVSGAIRGGLPGCGSVFRIKNYSLIPPGYEPGKEQARE
jgi:hypothetical protein